MAGTKYTGGMLGNLVKDVEQNALNPLGLKTTKLAGALTLAGIAAWGIGAGVISGREQVMQQNAEYVGNVPSMDYDGSPNVDTKTGKPVFSTSGARNFGATGDLVFGLNNSRRG
jgi:hypothetical protein